MLKATYGTGCFALLNTGKPQAAAQSAGEVSQKPIDELPAWLRQPAPTQAPLATVVIGGLLASTALSLLVVPTVYLLIARRSGDRFISRRTKPAAPVVSVGTDVPV